MPQLELDKANEMPPLSSWPIYTVNQLNFTAVKFRGLPISLYFNYRPRSEGDNALGSVHVSVRPFACTLTAELFDLRP